MSRKALLATMTAKPDKAAELEAFLRDALDLAEAESDTRTWYAVRFSDRKFGIFDSFDSEEGREAHLNGKIAAALIKRSDELLESAPTIEHLDIIAST